MVQQSPTPSRRLADQIRPCFISPPEYDLLVFPVYIVHPNRVNDTLHSFIFVTSMNTYDLHILFVPDTGEHNLCTIFAICLGTFAPRPERSDVVDLETIRLFDTQQPAI